MSTIKLERPHCASGSQTCNCPSKFVSKSQYGLISYSTTTGDKQCDAPLGWEARNQYGHFSSSGSYDRRNVCGCGRKITPSEQWSIITENCPPISSKFRSQLSQNDECFGTVLSYSDSWSTFDNRLLYGRAYPNVPIHWRSFRGQLQKHSLVTVKVDLPIAADNDMTIKIVDSNGDGIQEGYVSLYKSSTNITDSNLMKIKRAFTRQDVYGSTVNAAGGGDQSAGNFICNSMYKVDSQSDLSLKDCRSKCVSKSKDCTHFAWVTVACKQYKFKPFFAFIFSFFPFLSNKLKSKYYYINILFECNRYQHLKVWHWGCFKVKIPQQIQMVVNVIYIKVQVQKQMQQQM